MHSKGVLHRDIKPENIFLMIDGSIKLGDFGLAKELTDKYYATVAGTKMYFSSDIFAVGICIFELITGQHPFAADSEQLMIEKIKNGDASELPEYVPTEIKKLLESMLSN
ncbi:MAG: hypothetical protein EZS28_041653, partial [Streblomastix strix]